MKRSMEAVVASSLSEPDTADILWRVKRIAAFLDLPEKAAQHRIDKGEIPTFRMGGTICARRSTLLAWIAAQEARSAHRPRGDREPEGERAA